MNIGQMRYFIRIYKKVFSADKSGFKTETDVLVVKCRAYREGRHGSEKWANMATFSDATELFRFRVIPGKKITTDMIIVCGEDRFEILSVEDIKGRGMYMEALCREVKASG